MKGKKDKRGEYAFVGCMFIGMGIGYYINNLLVGMFSGMGVGFLVRIFFYVKIVRRRKGSRFFWK